MGQSIGDLFVKLGFDVDDGKLKSFDQSLKDVFNSVLKFAGISATTAGFVEIAKSSSDTAVIIENLTKTFGFSTKVIQEWGSALREANPLLGKNEGVASLGNLGNYLRAAQFGGGAQALNRLGVQYTGDMAAHPETVISKLFDTVPGMIKQYGRPYVSKFLDEIFGNVNAINIFDKGRAAYEAAGQRGVAPQSELDEQVRARENIAELQNMWDKFINHIAATLLGGGEQVIKEYQQKGTMAAVSEVGKQYGGWTDYLNPILWADKTLGWMGYDTGYVPGTMKKKGAPGAPGGSPTDTLQGYGWNSAQAAGMVKRLMLESGMNPDAYGTGSEAKGMPGEAYGIAQWHPDRQANFARWAGKDIHGSSMQEQMAFLNYELTQGMERKAGEKLRQMNTADDAYKSFTNDFERPAVTQTNTFNITGSDPHQTADAVRTMLENEYTAANLNRNYGGTQ